MIKNYSYPIFQGHWIVYFQLIGNEILEKFLIDKINITVRQKSDIHSLDQGTLKKFSKMKPWTNLDLKKYHVFQYMFGTNRSKNYFYFLLLYPREEKRC